MFSLFAANVHLTRPVFAIAKYAFSNPGMRSFITSSRVADTKPKNASPGPTTEKKSKREKPEKTDKPKRIIITKDMKPPSRPNSPYLRFVKEYVTKRPKSSSRAETAALVTAAAAEWKTLSDAAKATYAEGYDQELEEYRKKRAAWIESIDPATARMINGARKAAGKQGYPFKMTDKPDGPYLRFFIQFQQSVDLESIGAPERARRAGEIWRLMPQDEKQQYFDSYARDRDEWLARRASVKA